MYSNIICCIFEYQIKTNIMKTQDTATKLKRFIKELKEEVNKDGHTKFSTCDHYNWDRDIFNHREEIIQNLRNEGLNVGISSKWGVLDINISKNILN